MPKGIFLEDFNYRCLKIQEWSVQWHKETPIIPTCDLQLTFPSLIFIMMLLAFVLHVIIVIRHRKDRPRKLTLGFFFKLLFAVCLLLINLVTFSLLITHLNVYDVHCLIKPFTFTIYVILYCCVVLLERKYDTDNSAFCFFSVLSLTILSALYTWNHVMGHHNTFDDKPLSPEEKKNSSYITLKVLDFVHFGLCGVLFIVNCISERSYTSENNVSKKYSTTHAKKYMPSWLKKYYLSKDQDAKNKTEEGSRLKEEGKEPVALSPERDSSYLSQLTYSWFTKLIITGVRKPLTFENLWDLNPEDRADCISRKFFCNLEKNVKPVKPVCDYVERRRASLGNCVWSDADMMYCDETRRKSAQSTRSNEEQFCDQQYTSGVAGEPTENYETSARRSSRDKAALNENETVTNIVGGIDSEKMETKLNSDTDNEKYATESLTSPVDTTVTPSLKKSGTRRSVRVRVGNKSIFIPGQSESLSDSNVLTTTDDQGCDEVNDPVKRSKMEEISLNHPNNVNSFCPLKRNPPDDPQLKNELKRTHSGLVRALLITYWQPLLKSAVMKLFLDLLLFANPLLLKRLLHFFQNMSAEPNWHGYFYGVLMFAVGTLQTMLIQRYFHCLYILAMHVKTGINAVVYRKSLRLSNSARRASTIGQILNLMSTDAKHFVLLIPFIHILWSAPLQIIIALILLWNELGASVIAGITVLLLMLPLTIEMGRRSKHAQKQKSTYADTRIKFINELLNGILVIKLYAWELSLIKKINEIRKTEVSHLRKFLYLQSTSTIWMCTPFLVGISTFTVYILISSKNILDAEKAFVSLALFNIMRFPLLMFPNVINNLVQCIVSTQRLTRFLLSAEIDSNAVSNEDTPGVAAVIERGVFAWDPKEEPVLKNISLQFPEGQLTSIIGSVGSGKSSLLHALLGHMEKFEGKVNVKGSIAYLPQEAWIYNATLRDNILFHKPYHPVRYERVLEACCLKPDILILPNGDLTEIGDKGVNLSGGQKQRVSLARACYADKDVYLLDDPLSAVDAHVCLELLTKVLSRSTGLLASKTCILVTHTLKALPFSDRVGLMVYGQLVELGNYKKLVNSRNSRLANFIHHNLHLESECQKSPPASEHGSHKSLSASSRHSMDSHTSYTSLTDDGKICNMDFLTDNVHEILSSNVTLSEFETESCIIKRNSLTSNKPDTQKYEFTSPEKAETGRVKFGVILAYFKNIGLLLCLLIALLFLCNQICTICTNIWLAFWSDDATTYRETVNKMKSYPNITSLDLNDSTFAHAVDDFISRRNFRLGIYGLLGSVQIILAILAIYSLVYGHVLAVGRLHDNLLVQVVHAAPIFFESVPQGRIVNRFSHDVATMDIQILTTLNTLILCTLSCVFVLIITCTLNPWLIIPVASLSLIYIFIQHVYVTNSRQLKRLESIAQSPVFSHFSETLAGVYNIRAYRMAETYEKINALYQDKNNAATYTLVISQRWLGMLLESIGNLITLSTVLIAVTFNGNVSAGYLGIIVTYLLSLNQSLNWLVRMGSEFENNIVSVERIKEYTNIDQEADWESDYINKLPASWPNGEIEFINFTARYREDHEPVLKAISIKIKPGYKLGIVGRTGAGKSSLVSALFRILEPCEGRILIDGHDIRNLGLHDLRSRITLIPQDPVLFTGSLRFNMDPFEQYSDQEIWSAVELSHLKTHLVECGNDIGLDINIDEGGSNLSLGQRQLLCLARAILRGTSILVLDEATAAVDVLTDNLIQQTIRTEFKRCTVLTIAHRINTILDYDGILVLDKGVVIEFDSPQRLLRNKNSQFYAMARDAHIID